MKKTQGFTLIELLVVIAIIGILASVILAALSTARNKGADAAVEANLANARAEGELFYDANGNKYAGTADLCVSGNMAGGTTATNGTVKGIQEMVLAAAKAAGLGSVATNPASPGGTLTTATCNSAAGAWAAEVPLKTQANKMWCVDNAGDSRVESATIGLNTVCA